MTAKSKSFWKIFTAHSIAFIIYMIFVINYSKLLTGHDEYGLGQLGLGITFIVIHIIVGFFHGLYVTLKRLVNGFQKKTQKTPKDEIELAEKLKKQYFDGKDNK